MQHFHKVQPVPKMYMKWAGIQFDCQQWCLMRVSDLVCMRKVFLFLLPFRDIFPGICNIFGDLQVLVWTNMKSFHLEVRVRLGLRCEFISGQGQTCDGKSQGLDQTIERVQYEWKSMESQQQQYVTAYVCGCVWDILHRFTNIYRSIWLREWSVF